MNLNKIYFGSILLLTLIGCDHYNKEHKPLLEATVIVNDTDIKPYIDVDFSMNKLKSSNSKEIKYATDAVYSAYKRALEHIEVKNGLYHLKIKDCKEINISPQLFNIVKGIIRDTNNGIKELKKQGYDLPAVENIKILERKHWKWEKCLELNQKYNQN